MTAIRADEPIGDAGFKLIGIQVGRLCKFEERVRATGDAEAIHDMRVAARRLNSLLRLLQSYLPNKQSKRQRPLLRELRDTLGSVRNLDVMLADLAAFAATRAPAQAAGLEPLRDYWSTRRAGSYESLTALLDSKRYRTWLDNWAEFNQADPSNGQLRVLDVLPELVWHHYGRVREYEHRVKNATPPELHPLRIRIKRLRYTLEFFSEPLAIPDQELIQPLIALQDLLGVIQDSVVASQAASEFVQSWEWRRGPADAVATAVTDFRVHLETRIQEMLEQLPTNWSIVMHPAYRLVLAAVVASP